MINDTHSSIPIFVINLPQSTDRKAFMKNHCESIDISPVFIDAVYGKDLSKSDIERYVGQDTAKKLFGRELLLGEIGCALSHKKIYQKIANENIPYAVILEDDAIVEEGFNEIVKSILYLNLSWDLVLLGHHKDINKGLPTPISIWDRHDLTKKISLNRLADFGFGTYGYMITIEGAKKLTAELDNIHKPIDHYTSDSNIINVYALSPTVVNVNDGFVTLIDESEVRKNISDRLSVVILKRIGIINTMVRLKSFFKSLKPIKKYK